MSLQFFLLIMSALVVILVAVLRHSHGENAFPDSGSQKSFSTPPQYRKRFSVMNKSEEAFFFELQRQLPQGYHIFPKMRIADMIDAVNGHGFYHRRNKILPKHVDFLVCDSRFSPVVAIEVNGSSHQRADRIERDELVTQIFVDAKIPLIFVNVGANFAQSVTEIVSTVGSK